MNQHETPAEKLAVRRATSADFPRVLDFYGRMIDAMQGTDFDIHWKRGVHPSDEMLAAATGRGECILGIAEDGAIACAMVVNHAGAPGYEAVPWHVDAEPEQVGVIHVLATLPAYHKRGFATQLMNGAIELSRQAGMKALRLDMLTYNWRARKLYESCGFKALGTYELEYDLVGSVEADLFEYEL